jgi:hypothetical protein
MISSACRGSSNWHNDLLTHQMLKSPEVALPELEFPLDTAIALNLLGLLTSSGIIASNVLLAPEDIAIAQTLPWNYIGIDSSAQHHDEHKALTCQRHNDA